MIMFLEISSIDGQAQLLNVQTVQAVVPMIDGGKAGVSLTMVDGSQIKTYDINYDDFIILLKSRSLFIPPMKKEGNKITRRG